MTSISFCEKIKLYLVVMTESDAMQDRRWDKGNKKDDNWRRDKEREGYHPTIVFKDPTDGFATFNFFKDETTRYTYTMSV